MRLLEVVGVDLERAELVRTPAVVPGEVLRGGRLEGGDLDVLGVVDRELEEAAPHLPEQSGVSGREEAIRAFTSLCVLDSLALEGLRNLPCSLLRGEDERHAATEDALKDRSDERVVGAAEDRPYRRPRA